MRTVLVLLLLANLTLFGFTKLDTFGSGEAVRLKEQVRPDKIAILTPQQVAALGPGKVASLPDVCIEWGPLSDADRTRALSDLESLELGRLLTQRRVEVDNSYWVSLPPFPNRAAADRRAAELRTQGVSDLSVVDSGRGQFTVSLGVFRTEQSARTRAEALAQQGVGNTRVEPRNQSAAQTMLVVRDPQQPVVARLKELQTQYAGSDLRVGACQAS
jgi:hypothetical protein